MAAYYSEDRTGWSLTPGVSAQRVFFIVGAKSFAEAVSARPERGVQPWQNTDDTHPDDKSLLCKPPVYARRGLGFTRTCNYGNPPNGSWGDSTTTTKTTKPQLAWSLGRVSYAIDRDRAGNPIINAAGDVLAGQSIDLTVATISYTRVVSTFDFNRLETMFNSVNSKAVTLKRAGGKKDVVFAAGDLLYRNSVPSSAYTPGDAQMTITDTFEYLNEFTFKDGKAKKLSDPHQIYLINKGRHGWATFNGKKIKGELAYDQQAPIGEEVPLNDQGLPVDDKLMVVSGIYGNQWKKPEPPPESAVSKKLVFDKDRKGDKFWVLKFVRFGSLDLNDVFK